MFGDIVKLVSGTLGGRLILLAVLPLVARLYSPEDFAVLAVYSALVATASVAACLRLDIAIPLAETDEQAADLFLMALMVACVLSIAILVISLIAADQIADAIGTPEIAPFLWLVGPGVFLAAFYTALLYWATRARRFGSIARTRLGQAGIGAGTMLGLGWLGVSPIGLLLGNMLSNGGGVFHLGHWTLRQDGARLRAVTRARISATLTRYQRYPLLSTPEALANVAGIQIPILMIAARSGDEAGQLFFAMQLMAAPMALLGTSVGQVYVSRAAEELSEGRLAGFTARMMRRLFLIGLGPMALAAILSPWLFPLILGDVWARAGMIVAWIAPWMLMQLVASPVSLVMAISGRQKHMLALTTFGALLRIFSVLIGSIIAPQFMVVGYALSSVAFYTICAAVFYAASRTNKLCSSA